MTNTLFQRIVKRIKKELFNFKNRRFYPYTLSAHKHYSQYKQDIFVKNYYKHLPHKERYIFVDIGANDGITYSNSYLLENDDEQNWEGILIEADCDIFEKCCLNRKHAHKYNVALCNIDGKVDFMQIIGSAQMLSGIINDYSIEHLSRIHREIEEGGDTFRIISMEGARFSTIMSKHPDIQEIDYLSIDVEGSEMNILHGIDFQKYKINLIGIEDNYPGNSQIEEFLKQHQYKEIYRLGCDRFFEKEKSI